MAKQNTYYKKIPIDPIHGGYSDIRLWPCYMLFTGSILLLSPLIGLLFSILMCAIPALILASKAARLQDSNPEALNDAQRLFSEIHSNIKLCNKLQANIMPTVQLHG